MLRTISVIFVVTLSLSLFAFKANEAGLLWFANTKDLGKIDQGKPAKILFEFKNTASQPLLITDVKTSCGCTATSWPKEPLEPGVTSHIEVVYSARSVGNFHKSIKVFTDKQTQPYTLNIVGEVIASIKQ